MSFDDLSRDQIQALFDEQTAAYRALQERGLKLDLTRGKPSPEQLDLSNELLSLPGADFKDASGTDTRNYGGLTGLLELREIFAPIMRVPTSQVVAGDNASLAMMHDNLVFALFHGVPDSEQPWGVEESVKFVCPAPGYDRHFALLEEYGIEMVTVPMNADGPDVDAVREAVKDPAVKGMWLVPTYSNPTGAVISEAVAAELAALETAAPDFRIFWDNAYAVHHLTDQQTKTPDILGLCVASGHPNRPVIFASTSKITFAGAGVSFLGSSPDNIAWYLSHLGKRTIGPDKVNQLRHARYLGSTEGVHALMERHRAILAPKFETVVTILRDRLAEYGIADWTEPAGGYFVSLDVLDGTASRVVELTREAGVAMTPAGAAFPYGEDPRDRNIRIAPSFPSPDDLATAIDVLATSVLIAAAEQYLA
ncbi:aminotransferase class I/II-fold pyridoxal phosphate-dependent enzyme [Aeromicrobium wangtongii]|uniref:Aminotransferase class I/II-fold pyridoxal phosphate-dependent enzyme n=1 Tax=Aeromicrobium wangtongii TaxID=2969247 RepID=A0ABY5ME73_9ACTN|nr:aminotransferase class I/II-fold pyridoxal phosphate-dependent enzyme [Aeromicrobium wangtongii]MCD9197506.1 aminotransferase class I/II-fold pyridoxal phosphate-dependent enzyme [Aeromicrobium wangtongii]UUP14998.1 aminotransferase class I/II-fold pyridoxal phosphate-dependent enzyme [Aeromicrobium wangtongii]